MNKRIQHHAISACALAATLFLAACGGGASTDTVPPTVVITSAAGTGSTVLFSFAFSEALASNTFTVDDIVVSGGTAGTFTMVDATHATLVVTPTSGALGVSVAANKFDDLAHNFNTVAASNTFNPVSINFSESNLSLASFNGATASIASDPDTTNAGNQVLKVVKDTSGNAGVTVFNSAQNTVAPVQFQTSKIITLRVYSPAAGKVVMLKVEDGANVNHYVEKSVTTQTTGAWETLTFDYTTTNNALYDSTFTYNKISIFPDFGGNTAGTYYFDNLIYAGGSANSSIVVTPPAATAPTTAAATPPARVSTDVISIYSDAYAATAGISYFPNWGQSTVDAEVTVAGNNTRKYTNFNYEGITFTPIDVSSMTKLHIDVWTPDITALDVFILSGAPAAEQSLQVTPTKAGWNSFDIDLAGFTNPNKAAIKEMKLVATGGSTMYFDNLYFYKPASTGGGGSVPATLAYSSGYTDPAGSAQQGTTAEGGLWGYYSDGFPNPAATFAGGTSAYRYIGTDSPSVPTLGSAGTYMGIYNLYKSGGLTLSGQTSVTIELAADADYIASGKDVLRVDVVGSELFNNGSVADCVVVVSGTVKPTSTALTAYKIPLTTFGQGCNQASITTAAQVLTHPIGKVAVTADWPNINTTTATPAGHYITAFTIGNITFTP